MAFVRVSSPRQRTPRTAYVAMVGICVVLVLMLVARVPQFVDRRADRRGSGGGRSDSAAPQGLRPAPLVPDRSILRHLCGAQATLVSLCGTMTDAACGVTAAEEAPPVRQQRRAHDRTAGVLGALLRQRPVTIVVDLTGGAAPSTVPATSSPPTALADWLWRARSVAAQCGYDFQFDPRQREPTSNLTGPLEPLFADVLRWLPHYEYVLAVRPFAALDGCLPLESLRGQAKPFNASQHLLTLQVPGVHARNHAAATWDDVTSIVARSSEATQQVLKAWYRTATTGIGRRGKLLNAHAWGHSVQVVGGFDVDSQVKPTAAAPRRDASSSSSSCCCLASERNIELSSLREDERNIVASGSDMRASLVRGSTAGVGDREDHRELLREEDVDELIAMQPWSLRAASASPDLDVLSLPARHMACFRQPCRALPQGALPAAPSVARRSAARDRTRRSANEEVGSYRRRRKFAVLSMYEPASGTGVIGGHEPLMAYDAQWNRRQYAARNGYGVIWEDDSVVLPSAGRTPHWGKIVALAKWLPHYDWIWWLDADAVIMNHSIPLESIVDRYANDETVDGRRVHLLICREEPASTFNTGSMLLRGLRGAQGGSKLEGWPDSMDFLRAVYNTPTSKWHHFEQGAINYRIAAASGDSKSPFSVRDGWTRQVPGRVMNAYPPNWCVQTEAFAVGDLMVHMPDFEHCVNTAESPYSFTTLYAFAAKAAKDNYPAAAAFVEPCCAYRRRIAPIMHGVQVLSAEEVVRGPLAHRADAYG
jgi:hypothetical protein